MIQENADSTVLKDIKNFLMRIAPEDNYLMAQRSRRYASSFKKFVDTIKPNNEYKNKKYFLGPSRNLLLEHRYQPKNRELFFHLLGE